MAPPFLNCPSPYQAQLRNYPADTLGYLDGSFEVRVRKNRGHLVASVAGHHGGIPSDGLAESPACRTQALVPHAVYLIVFDIEAARKELLSLSVEISDAFHGYVGIYNGPDDPSCLGGDGLTPGPPALTRNHHRELRQSRRCGPQHLLLDAAALRRGSN